MYYMYYIYICIISIYIYIVYIFSNSKTTGKQPRGLAAERPLTTSPGSDPKPGTATFQGVQGLGFRGSGFRV